MRKKDIHPEWFEESTVFCNGEEVLVTSGTKASYTGESLILTSIYHYLSILHILHIT